jgi:hypothetical protein
MSSVSLLVWSMWVDKERAVELWEEEVNGNVFFCYRIACYAGL